MTPELRGPSHRVTRITHNGTRAAKVADARAQAILAPLVDAVVLHYDVDREHVRRHHEHHPASSGRRRPWRWSMLEVPPPTRERYARWTCMYVLHEADVSMAAIGRALGTDHTTVRNALHRMESERIEVRQFAADLVHLFARTGRIAS